MSMYKQINRVLIVDDDPMIRDMMVDILASEGYVSLLVWGF